MGDGYSQRIVGVAELTFGFLERKQRTHHVLYLLLGCITVARYGLFDDTRRVFGNRKTTESCRYYSNTARLPKFHGGLCALIIEGRFDRKFIGTGSLDDSTK